MHGSMVHDGSTLNADISSSPGSSVSSVSWEQGPPLPPGLRSFPLLALREEEEEGLEEEAPQSPALDQSSPVSVPGGIWTSDVVSYSDDHSSTPATVNPADGDSDISLPSTSPCSSSARGVGSARWQHGTLADWGGVDAVDDDDDGELPSLSASQGADVSCAEAGTSSAPPPAQLNLSLEQWSMDCPCRRDWVACAGWESDCGSDGSATSTGACMGGDTGSGRWHDADSRGLSEEGDDGTWEVGGGASDVEVQEVDRADDVDGVDDSVAAQRDGDSDCYSSASEWAEA